MMPAEMYTSTSGRWITRASSVVRFVLGVWLSLLLIFAPITFFTDSSLSFSFGGLSASREGIELSGVGTVSGSFANGSGQTDSDRATLREFYGTAAELDGETRVVLNEHRPDALGVGLAAVVLALAHGACLLFLLWLDRLFAKVLAGDPFDPSVVRALRGMAGTVAIGAIGYGIGTAVLSKHLVSLRGGEASFELSLHLSVAIWAVFLLALAEVWRYGIDLQRDVEATV